MNNLNEHYRVLLGLDESWTVSDVDLQLEESSVVIELSHRGGPLTCPECQGSCGMAALEEASPGSGFVEEASPGSGFVFGFEERAD